MSTLDTTVAAPRIRRGRPLSYQWDRMEIGDIRVIGGRRGESLRRLRNRINASLRSYARERGLKFVYRSADSGRRLFVQRLK